MTQNKNIKKKFPRTADKKNIPKLFYPKRRRQKIIFSQKIWISNHRPMSIEFYLQKHFKMKKKKLIYKITFVKRCLRIICSRVDLRILSPIWSYGYNWKTKKGQPHTLWLSILHASRSFNMLIWENSCRLWVHGLLLSQMFGHKRF